jgi:hypothetical protein
MWLNVIKRKITFLTMRYWCFWCMYIVLQEGPKSVAAYLSKERVLESFKVVLVGPDGQTDLLKQKALKLPSLHVDTRRIYNFLVVRRGLGVDTQSGSWEVPDIADLDTVFKGLTELLVNSARRVTSETELAVECMIGNDVANVRGDDDDEPELSTGPAAHAENDGDDMVDQTPDLDHRGVLSVNGVGGSAAFEQAIRICLQGVLKTVRSTEPSNNTAPDGEDVQMPDVDMQSSRSSETVNEFTDNDTALYGAFWYEFFLNKGLKSGSVSLTSRRHLLLQYTGVFARNQEFVFLLANQTQRHAHARAVSAQVKSSKKSFLGFVEILNDVTFIPDLQEGIKNPRGKAASKVLRRIKPLLVSCSANIPFSAVSRNGDITILYNMRRCFGLPAWFITVSPDDIHNPMVLRMALWTASCLGFPTTDEGFTEALRNGATSFSTGPPAATYDIRLDEKNLRRIVGDNPVAAAEVFNRMLVTIWKVLFGLEPSHLNSKGSKRTSPLWSASPGLFGNLSAAFGCTEEQTRKALHHHVLGFGGIPPELMQSMFPEFMIELGVILDTMLRAEVSPKVHVADIIRREMHVPGRRNAYFDCPEVSDPFFSEHSDVAEVSVGLHEHSLTCW